MISQLSAIRLLLKNHSLDAIFISSHPNILYLTQFSGFMPEERDAFLLITPKEQFIFTHQLYKEAAETFIKNFTFVQIDRENPLSKHLKKIIKEQQIKTLGFEAFDITVQEYEQLTKQVSKKILRPSHLLTEVRLRKSPNEIKKIQTACQIGDKAFQAIIKKIKQGVTEKTLTYMLETEMKQYSVDPSFRTIVAFGSNASHPHHVPTDKKLEKNSFVPFDFGIRYENYCSDMTRTVFFGKATPEEKKVYETVLTSQQKAIDTIRVFLKQKTGKSQKQNLASIDQVSRDYIISQGFPSLPHALGHGIGIEVHEAPRLSPGSKEIIQNGIVFSIEPGIYLPGKLGVRIEDLFAIENNTLTQLTKAPREFIEV